MSLATPTRRMPQTEALREFVAELLDKRIEVTTAADLDLDRGGLFTGMLLDDTDRLAGLIVMDLEFASNAGASLVMVPVAAATEAIESGELTESLRENCSEVANIMTGLINGPSVAHIRLGELVDGVPDEARDLVMRAAGRRTYDIAIAGYGDGTVTLIAE